MARKVEYVRYAQHLGVNTDQLFRLQTYVQYRACLLLEGSSKKTLVPINRHALNGGNDLTQFVFQPPYMGSVDMGYYSITDDGELRELNSFLDPQTAVSGGGVRLRNWSADNDDHGLAYQENGYLGCYVTGDRPGSIVITQMVKCLFKPIPNSGTPPLESAQKCALLWASTCTTSAIWTWYAARSLIGTTRATEMPMKTSTLETRPRQCSLPVP